MELCWTEIAFGFYTYCISTKRGDTGVSYGFIFYFLKGASLENLPPFSWRMAGQVKFLVICSLHVICDTELVCAELLCQHQDSSDVQHNQSSCNPKGYWNNIFLWRMRWLQTCPFCVKMEIKHCTLQPQLPEVDLWLFIKPVLFSFSLQTTEIAGRCIYIWIRTV